LVRFLLTVTPSQLSHFDTAVIGDGIIGLSAALELARSGASCALFGASELGAGSGAAAGILAPSVGQRDSEIRNFFRYSLDLFPAFLAPLREFDPDLEILAGLLETVPSRPAALDADSRWVSDDELRRTEPAISAPNGAVLHAHDGAVDSTRVVAALRRAVSRHPRITVDGGNGVASIDLATRPARVVTRNGSSIRANSLVLAAGAWSPQIGGLPRRVPVSPLKGQIIAFDAPGLLRHPVSADHVYLVPRGRELVVGATSEDAGFDTTTSEDGERSLYAAATRVCPPLADVRVARRWAGLRPATNDMLPILGEDPESPALIYACGHSRNGILLAPVTALAVRAFAEGAAPVHPAIGRFSIARFGN
jgi:glycine/D-amino acid oxidase-like deaminating enzyme